MHLCPDELRLLALLLPFAALVWRHVHHTARCAGATCRRVICRALRWLEYL